MSEPLDVAERGPSWRVTLPDGSFHDVPRALNVAELRELHAYALAQCRALFAVIEHKRARRAEPSPAAVPSEPEHIALPAAREAADVEHSAPVLQDPLTSEQFLAAYPEAVQISSGGGALVFAGPLRSSRKMSGVRGGAIPPGTVIGSHDGFELFKKPRQRPRRAPRPLREIMNEVTLATPSAVAHVPPIQQGTGDTSATLCPNCGHAWRHHRDGICSISPDQFESCGCTNVKPKER